jgi:hypothetical protein
MGPTECSLVAGLIDWIEGPRSDHGAPCFRLPAATCFSGLELEV